MTVNLRIEGMETPRPSSASFGRGRSVVSIRKEGRLFVLGAGFSHGAGYPLGPDLKPRVLRYIDDAQEQDIRETRDKVYRALGDLDQEVQLSFDEFARACGHDHPDALRTLRLACRGLFWSIHPSAKASAPYRAFARWASTGVGVLSFNWDLLVERAAKDSGLG